MAKTLDKDTKTLDKDVTEFINELKDSKTPLGEFVRIVTALDKQSTKQALYQTALYALARNIDQDRQQGRPYSVELVKSLIDLYAPKAGLSKEKIQNMYNKVERAKETRYV